MIIHLKKYDYKKLICDIEKERGLSPIILLNLYSLTECISGELSKIFDKSYIDSSSIYATVRKLMQSYYDSIDLSKERIAEVEAEIKNLELEYREEPSRKYKKEIREEISAKTDDLESLYQELKEKTPVKYLNPMRIKFNIEWDDYVTITFNKKYFTQETTSSIKCNNITYNFCSEDFTRYSYFKNEDSNGTLKYYINTFKALKEALETNIDYRSFLLFQRIENKLKEVLSKQISGNVQRLLRINVDEFEFDLTDTSVKEFFRQSRFSLYHLNPGDKINLQHACLEKHLINLSYELYITVWEQNREHLKPRKIAYLKDIINHIDSPNAINDLL